MIKCSALLSIFLCFTHLCASEIPVYFGTGSGGAPSEGIYRAGFNTETGKLSTAELAAEMTRPGFLARHPSLSVLYAVGNVEGKPAVVAFDVQSDGSLTKINHTEIQDGGAAHLAVHPRGGFLMTAQYGGNSVTAFSLAHGGALGREIAHFEHPAGSGVVSNRQAKAHPHWVGFSPDGRFAFVPDLGMDQIVIYRTDAESNTITTHGYAESVPGGGPRHMRFSMKGDFIYLLNELTLSVSTFAYNASEGTAERLDTVPSLSEEVKAGEAFNSASEILVHPTGRYVYSANRGHDSVTVYKADPSDGSLEVIQVIHVRGSFPRNINLDPTGNWLLAAGQHSNTVAVFKIDSSTGRLQFQTRNVINVPSPICILF